MKLYLVQHGIASKEDIDPQKGLTPQGKEETKKLAQSLKRKGVTIDSIWHSNKLRAIQTAQIIVETFNATELIERDDLSPNDSVVGFESKILESSKDIMIVGHLPFLAKLACLLLSGNENFDSIIVKNSSALCLENSDRWIIRWMVTPD